MAFPVSPSDSDIATFNGADYIYVASKNAWVKTPLSYTVPQDLSDLTDTGGLLGGGGLTTYATLSELDATGNVAGSMGYVTATGNFYINNGTLWNKVISLIGTEPDAPTIGTATTFGDFAAYVDFTAPTYTGDTVITSYTATSDPSGGSGTLNQSGSGTITVTELTESTTYTFTVTATNSAGASLPSAASNSIITDARTPGTQKAIFGGVANLFTANITNLVSNIGVVANDTLIVGTARGNLAAAGYGTDKALFGYGYATATGSKVSMTNLVSNTGVVSADTTGVGSERYSLAAAGYGGDKAIFGYGLGITFVVSTYNTSITNKVSNTGVVATDTTGVGTVRYQLAAAGYGEDKAIFGYGYTTLAVSMTNKVSNTGVVASDTSGVGTARYSLAAAGYGGDKAIFGYGYTSVRVSMTNKVSNTGVVSADTTGVGSARHELAAAGYGGDKALFGYGSGYNITNLVSNTGVVSDNTTGVGTRRTGILAAAGFSLS